ncbi:MAG: hypothetical protein JOZ74_18465 [Bradyrhizobium sp.]|nr:hypothetical protein [Bradyrhizobium sp.]
MSRFKILVSVVPLVVAAILARVEFFPSPRPCIALGAGNLEIASAPWHADLHVSFTDDPRLATVRVAISDTAETADFAVVDDVESSEEAACDTTPATRFIAISAQPSSAATVIYLAQGDAPADYRIFVRSPRFTAREAAALIVGAHGQRPHLADAAL